MYKIGEFSNITGLTIKALRYYDDEGLLNPTRSEENNYRLYREDDYQKALRIIMLKDFEFSVSEIKDVLTNFEDEEDILSCLMEKQHMISEQIKKQKQIISKLKSKTITISKKKENMEYKFEIKNIEPVRVISIREKLNWQDTGKIIGKLYSIAKAKTNGSMTTIYHDGEYKDIADMEICVPVSSAIHKDGVENKVLPAVKVLSTTHIGRYEDLKRAYKAVYDYAKENDIMLTNPQRELYHKGPGMIFSGNPDKYITEVMFPIKS